MRSLVLSTLLLIASACDAGALDRPRGDGGGTTGGDGSLAARPDSGGAPDVGAASPDGGGATLDSGTASTDAAVPGCAACPTGTTCFRDVCLDTCGSRTLPFTDADLAPELRPLWHTCPVLRAGAAAAIGNRLVHATAVTRERTTSITLSTLPIRPTATPGPVPLCNITYQADRDGLGVSLYPQVALSPRGGWAHVALETRDPLPANVGVSYLVELATCAVTEQPVTWFGGAALFSEGPADLLLMQRPGPMGRPAVFHGGRAVIDAEVWLMRRGSDQVLFSVMTGHGMDAVASLPLSAVRAGPHPLTPRGGPFDGWPLPRETLADGDVIGVPPSNDTTHPFERYAVDLSAPPGVGLGPPTFFASRVFHFVAPVEGTAQVALLHAGGVLVVE